MKCGMGRAQRHGRKRISYLEIILQESLKTGFLGKGVSQSPLKALGREFSSSGDLLHFYQLPLQKKKTPLNSKDKNSRNRMPDPCND